MWSALVLCAVSVVTAPPVTATTLDGKTHSGKLVSATRDGVVIETQQGPVTLASDDLATVKTQSMPARPKAAVTMELVDGSVLEGSQFRFAAGKVTLVGLDKTELSVTRRGVKWVRWPQSKTTANAWQQVIETPASSGDLLIVRKTSSSGQPVFDPLEGVVQSVSSQAVGFQFDDDTINVKPEKVEGIVFFKPAAPGNASLICKVQSNSWGSLQAAELLASDESLQVKTVSGAQIDVPWSAGVVLDFRAGNIQWLAELTPDSVAAKFNLQPAGMTFGFNDLFQPQNAGPFGGQGLKLGKQTFDSGLSLHSPTKLTYRIPDGFSRLRMTVGLADEAGAEANVQVRILGDQKELWSQTFSETGTDEPVEVECNLAESRRLSIVIDQAAGLDFGDIVILGNARFVK